MRPPAATPAPSRDPMAAAVSLARSRAPLRRELARVAARVVATKSWERLGFARLRDYAVERAGLSARELRDLAHVDAALGGLSAIDAAFTSGELSWTKTRLLCRVATADDESDWLAFSARHTARSLAREVRAVDARAVEAGGAQVGEPGGEYVTVFLRCSGETRARWCRTRRVAWLVAGERLGTWAAMEAVAVEVLSQVPLDPAVAWPDPSADRPAGRAPGARPPDAHPVDGTGGAKSRVRRGSEARADPGAEGLEDPFELDARLRSAVHAEQRLLARLGPLLLAVATGRLFRGLGLRAMDDFARERLDMSPRRCQALLRLERAAATCPPLREAFRAGRLNWTQAHALVPILIHEHAAPWRRAWVEHAQRVSLRRLEDDVDRALETGVLACDGVGGPAGPQTGANLIDLASSASTEVAPARDPVRLHFRAPRDVARLFRAALATVQRRLEREARRPIREGEALHAMLDHALATWGGLEHWHAEAEVRRAHRVFQRDGWRCTAPGCSSYRNLHDHHIRFRSAGGDDELANRTTLCAWHHLRGVHGGVVRCTGRAPDGLHFALGVRPRGPALVVYGPREVLRQ